MPQFGAPVKCPLEHALGQLSRRSLWAVAHYHYLPANHEVAHAVLAAALARQILTRVADGRLAALLTHHDLALFAQLCAGVPSAIPPADLLFPWHLAQQQAPLADLRPIERLMALGLVCPLRGPQRIDLLIPDEVVADLRAWRDTAPPPLSPLAPGPSVGPLALLEDAVTALASLVAIPVFHTPAGAWPLPLLRCLQQTSAAPDGSARRRLHRLHALLHAAGLLVADPGPCRPTERVPAWLVATPADQIDTLFAACFAAPLPLAELPPPLGPADLTGPPLGVWLRARLAAWGGAPQPEPALLTSWLAAGDPLADPAICTRSAAAAPLPPTTGRALLAALLHGPLVDLGLIQVAGAWVALTSAAQRWLAAPTQLAGAAAPPALVDATARFPFLAAAALRFQLAPWVEHTAGDATAQTYTFTLAGLRRGCTAAGSDRPLRALLQQHFGPLSPALAALLAAAARPAPCRLRAAVILQTADPATLTALLARRQPRRYLWEPLGPTAALVSRPAELQRYLERQALIAPAAALPPTGPAVAAAGIPLLILALRTACRATPLYAALFARQAADLYAHLAPAQQADLDDRWLVLDAEPAEEAVAPDAPPTSALDPAAVRQTLEQAIRAGTWLTVRYYTASRQVIGWRTIRPLLLRPPYLTAYCARTGANLTFHCARILAIRPLPDPALPPPHPPVR